MGFLGDVDPDADPHGAPSLLIVTRHPVPSSPDTPMLYSMPLFSGAAPTRHASNDVYLLGIALVGLVAGLSDMMRSLVGAELKEFYMTIGAHDMVVRIEASGDDAVAKFILALTQGGAVRTTTLKAFTEAEYREIIRSLP